MKGGIMDLLVKSMREATGDESIQRMNTGSHVIESEKEAKYNDLRKQEPGYIQGVHKAKTI